MNNALFSSCMLEEPKLHVRVFRPSDNHVSIVPLTDLHMGARKHNYRLLCDYITYIIETPDCYAIGLGDYIECATRTSVGLGMYEEDFHFPQQYERIEEILRPLARAGKLLGLHTGNHEMRATLAVGMDPIYMLAKALEVPYLGYTAFHKWIAGNTVYRVLTLHGRSMSKTPAGRLNALRALRDVAAADIYIMGHMHDKAVHRDTLYHINTDTDSVEAICRWYIIAGGLLDWPGSYADMMALPPVQPGLVKIDLYVDRKLVDTTF